MGKIVVVNNLTLDGVTQGLGHPDEDTRGGFEHGGWGLPYGDTVQGEAMGKAMAQTQGILMGRRTYEDFYGFWPHQTDNPYTEVLNQTPKYVASSTASEPSRGRTPPCSPVTWPPRSRPCGTDPMARSRSWAAASWSAGSPSRPRRRVPHPHPPADPGTGAAAVRRRRTAPRAATDRLRGHHHRRRHRDLRRPPRPQRLTAIHRRRAAPPCRRRRARPAGLHPPAPPDRTAGGRADRGCLRPGRSAERRAERNRSDARPHRHA